MSKQKIVEHHKTAADHHGRRSIIAKLQSIMTRMLTKRLPITPIRHRGMPRTLKKMPRRPASIMPAFTERRACKVGLQMRATGPSQ